MLVWNTFLLFEQDTGDMDLSDVTVLDLTRLLPGPYGSQLLADMGAEVIKIEPPDVGDYARFTEPIAPSGQGAVFTAINRGKKSVTLDLKDERGKAAFYRLAEDADVVFEQFRPGVADRLDVGYDDVSEYNEDIIYCSLSGYGQSGPYRDRVGHDLNYSGFAGLVDMTRDAADETPRIPGYPIGDMAGGVFSALSIVSALLSRELGDGDGAYIDISILDTLLSFSQAVMGPAMYGEDPRPGQTELTGKFPCYDVYQTKDDRYVTIAALEPKFWETLCDELGAEHLLEKHRSDDPAVRQAVREELQSTFRMKTRNEWESELGEKDVMLGLVNTPTEVLDDPQVRSRGIVTGDDELPRIGYPAEVESGLAGSGDSVPDMGEHTEHVLRTCGYSEGDLRELRDNGVITAPE
ncbi:MAG: alpha-methylacyl-CoA racemase [Natrialbaceae archaeon]